jgi:lipoprotein-anchoring transpeptidase ErfK/SrfK
MKNLNTEGRVHHSFLSSPLRFVSGRQVRNWTLCLMVMASLCSVHPGSRPSWASKESQSEKTGKDRIKAPIPLHQVSDSPTTEAGPANQDSSLIFISKEKLMLYHYNAAGELLLEARIACGKNWGNKRYEGDERTPEGLFRVEEIADASQWVHDFQDDTLGLVEGAYGSHFIRLAVPGHTGIGIHGTHDPRSIGSRASEGCIRMENGELQKLVAQIRPNATVIITPAQADLEADREQYLLQQAATADVR